MSIKGQDILVLLKLLVKELAKAQWSYQELAEELNMSSSEVHAALKRARKSNLVDLEKRYVIHTSLLEYLIHALKYSFPAERGMQVRGIPTGYAAPVMRNTVTHGDDLPPVWPHPEGQVKGIAMKPLYRSAPEAALKDEDLYRLLVFADMMRGGNARERKTAENEFSKILDS